MNTLYYGDNLKILQDRNYFPDACVDLIYLDPPFNSNRNYNVLFKNESGVEAESQITAFEDTWHWNQSAQDTYHELVLAGDEVAKMIEAFRTFIGENQMMAYLVMMAIRLKELHRVLKPTGSLYLHCDPTASHYLKILLDTIFGAENFRNEIVWKRQSAHSDSRGYGSVHDTIFFYVKTKDFAWNQLYQDYDPQYVDQYYRYTDENNRRFMSGDLGAAGLQGGGYEYAWKGITRLWRLPVTSMEALEKEGKIFYTRNGIPRIKRYLDEAKGMPVQDHWYDLESLRSWHAERLGYPTQKPVALLERIISASSNEGDVVLDPFCGCGTTIAAAQKLNRQWIGIDITHLSIALQKYRLKDAFGLDAVTGAQAKKLQDANDKEKLEKAYRIVGEPEDLEGARQLATEDRYQFQWWALSLIKAKPQGGSAGSKEGKKGSDKGIDGTIVFIDDASGKAKRAIVEVKSGHVRSEHIRSLNGVLERENAAIGIFITLEKPTRDMTTEAVTKGFYHSDGWNKDYPKLQILTIEELLEGKQPNMPPSSITFRQAERLAADNKNQGTLGF